MMRNTNLNATYNDSTVFHKEHLLFHRFPGFRINLLHQLNNLALLHNRMNVQYSLVTSSENSLKQKNIYFKKIANEA
ncbi:hypothetical protein HanIR_Chr14g0678561 [Helianthus annuus]|nr:hypothetical protein HanIR_Chr14g0678561 [Helianthus annuus]